MHITDPEYLLKEVNGLTTSSTKTKSFAASGNGKLNLNRTAERGPSLEALYDVVFEGDLVLPSSKIFPLDVNL